LHEPVWVQKSKQHFVFMGQLQVFVPPPKVSAVHLPARAFGLASTAGAATMAATAARAETTSTERKEVMTRFSLNAMVQ
jgi:hypothetical protein